MAKSEVFLTQMASVPIAEIMAGNFSPDFCSTWTDCPRRNLQNYMKDENITNFQLCTFRLKIRKSIFFPSYNSAMEIPTFSLSCK